MELLKEESKNLWKDIDDVDADEALKYQMCVTISSNAKVEDERIIYMEDIEKRKEVYGICGECNEPGTGYVWCQSCNAKRFKENFKNWTSGNKNIDEFIQQSQLNAVHNTKCLEWVPFEKFQNVTYVAEGGFGKIYSAEWSEGRIDHWDIENQKWKRTVGFEVALKSLNNSSNISTVFLNEIKFHHQIHLIGVNKCCGITQNPDTKDYMMILEYCNNGNLRNYLSKSIISYGNKLIGLFTFAMGLLDIHNAGLTHGDLHSGNVLSLVNNGETGLVIGDLGMCRPADNEERKKGVYGVLPYVAPEVLRGFKYTKEADIYSFGIVMNEFMSEEIPYNDIPHDQILTVGICNGLRPKISEDTPKLFADLIRKCWDAKPENRPAAKELYQIFYKWVCGYDSKNSVIYSQIKECEKIRESKLKNKPSKNETKSLQTHPQAIYTSRLLNFKNLPEPVNSSEQVNSLNSLDLSSYFQG